MISNEKKLTVNSSKLLELDYMRFIACFAVMIVHITATGVTDYIQGSTLHIISLLINRGLKFTTPVFIFLSGVTSFYSYKNKKFNYFVFLRKRLPRILIPYIIWCIIYYRVYIKWGYYVPDLGMLKEKLFDGTMSYHLYFVIIITQLYILGPIFYYIIKIPKNKIFVLITGVIITAICVQYLHYEHSDRIFLKYMCFYMIGIYVGIETEKFINFIKKFKIPIIIMYFIMVLTYVYVSYYNLASYNYVWFLFSLVSIFFVYEIGLFLKDKLPKMHKSIKTFGQSSYYIYLMHPLVLTYMIRYTTQNYILSVSKRLFMYFIVVIPVTVICALMYTIIKQRIQNKIKEIKYKKIAESVT